MTDQTCQCCGKTVKGQPWNGVFCDRHCEITHYRRMARSQDRPVLQKWNRYRRIKARQSERKRQRR